MDVVHSFNVSHAISNLKNKVLLKITFHDYIHFSQALSCTPLFYLHSHCVSIGCIAQQELVTALIRVRVAIQYMLIGNYTVSF